MDKQQAMCPKCRAVVELCHNGTEQTSDYTSPWVFVDHMCDDWRGDRNFPRQCTASGENVVMARLGY